MSFYNNTLESFDHNKNNSFPFLYLFILIFVLIWWIAGILAFLMSLICCFYNSSITDKFIGILLAWILGPFYWLFFIYNANYCTRFNSLSIQQNYY